MAAYKVVIETKIQKGKSGADQNFMEGLIAKNIGNQFSIEFEGLGGKDDDKFISVADRLFKQNEDGINIIVIDADNDDLNTRKSHIQGLLSSKNVDAAIFFFPDDVNPGELETLLHKTIDTEKLKYFDCLDKLDDCVKPISSNHIAPDLKTKLHLYTCSCLKANEQAQRGRLVYPSGKFFDKRFFDIDSKELEPLIKFLKNHIK